MSGQPRLFIVVYESDDGVFPMQWDDKCEGALHVMCSNEVAGFNSREDARKAIRVSRCFALLNLAQGKVHISDFTEGIKHVKVKEISMRLPSVPSR